MSYDNVAQVGIGSIVGGGLLSFFGALSQGVSTSNMYNYQAALARLNAEIARQNAEFAMQTGGQKNLEEGLRLGQQAGQIRTAEGASGFDVRSGSAAQVQRSQQTLGQIDLDMIRSNAAREAYGYKTQAAVSDSQAGVYKSASSNALLSGFVNAGSSILGTAGSVSSEWLKAKQVGLLSGGDDNVSIGGSGWTPPVPSFFGA